MKHSLRHRRTGRWFDSRVTTAPDRVTPAPDPLRLSLRIDSPPESVHTALTVPDAMTEWLTEHAEVSLPDGRYEFWGRYTPGGERPRQRLTGVEAGRRLSFAWQFDDADPSQVEITLSPAGEAGTTVAVTHSGVPTAGPADATALNCFWFVSVANLASYCEGSLAAPPFDFTATAQDEARVRMAIAAPVEEVFAALLDPAHIDKWAGGTAIVEPEIGGRYDFGWDHGPERILELLPDRILAYSWRFPDSPDTVVRWELRGSRGHTYLTLVHSGFADGGLAEQFRQGWPGFLVEIKRLHELGPRWQPIAS